MWIQGKLTLTGEFKVIGKVSKSMGIFSIQLTDIGLMTTGVVIFSKILALQAYHWCWHYTVTVP